MYEPLFHVVWLAIWTVRLTSVAVRIVVDEGTGVRLQLTDAALAQRFGLRQERDVVELAGHAGAADEAHVVLEAVADLHDRGADALQAVFPADRDLAGILVRA